MTRAARAQSGPFSCVLAVGYQPQVDHFKVVGRAVRITCCSACLDYEPECGLNSSEMGCGSFRLCCNKFRKLFGKLRAPNAAGLLNGSRSLLA